jgi:hypothetical protein
MKTCKPFARALFFVFLLACLLTGLAGTVRVSVNAAPQMQTATNVLISEFRTRGSNGAADEFIEIYNPTANPISISGWQIRVLTGTGTEAIRAPITSGTVLESGQYYLITNSSGYSGLVTADQSYTAGVVDVGGVALFDNLGNKIDSVGTTIGSIYNEGTNLSPLTQDIDQSYERRLGGISDSCTDTADNLADFQLIDPSDPQNRNSPLSLCGTILPTLTPTSTATATGTPTNTATITNTPTSSLAGVVISEFRTRGPSGAEDEYIELYNPNSTVVDISGWKINVSNDSGNTSTRATIPASTILRSGQYYLITNSSTNGYSGIVTANLTYGQGITNAGGIALVRPDNTVVDQVGVGASSAYKEGTPLSPLPSNSNQSYERKLGGASDSCQDTNDNANDFSLITSDPKNYSSQLSRCGTLLPIPTLTTTTITADIPDPSLVNASVIVSVKVTGGSIVPSGQVDITGANSNCTVTLNSSGTGSCSVVFSSTGTKTLTATYLGSQTYLASSDTETHQVATTIRTPTPTSQPTLPPPPPLVAINEFVPRPGHDWNNDGIINTGDEYIELLNHGVVDVNLSGYRLDDEANIGSSPFTLPSVILKPGERIVFYGSQTELLLSDGGDGVRLLKPNGQLADAYNYFVVNFPDQSFCRLPDNGGLDDWNKNCYPTPGLRNSLSGTVLRPPTQNNEDDPLCPVADNLPEDFILAECSPFGNNIWNRYYWDKFGWYDEMSLPNVNGKWDLFAD